MRKFICVLTRNGVEKQHLKCVMIVKAIKAGLDKAAFHPLPVSVMYAHTFSPYSSIFA